jgi:hypothetical protein
MKKLPIILGSLLIASSVYANDIYLAQKPSAVFIDQKAKLSIFKCEKVVNPLIESDQQVVSLTCIENCHDLKFDRLILACDTCGCTNSNHKK